jgi:SSS family solute:Na+ symporter
MVDTLLLGAVAAAYMAAILVLGYIGYKRTRGAEDYMVCGRRMHPVVLALSYGATFISTSAIVGFGGVAGQLGMGLIWLTVLTIGVGVFIAFVVYGKRTRAIGSSMNAITFPDLLGKRYRSKGIQTAAGSIIVGGMPLYTAAILIGGALFIQETFGLQYDVSLLLFAAIVAVYVVLGGLMAVMYTDALQGGIMLIGMLVLLVLTYSLLGGVSEANQSLTYLASVVPDGLAAAGHNGWTAMPDVGSSIWLTLMTTLVLGVGIGVLAQPQLAVRFMTVKDDRSLNRAVFVGGIFVLVMLISAFTVGALTNVYFMEEQGVLAQTAAGGNVDSIIPLYINSAMPDYFVVIFTLALLAAAMSTLSSLYHTMGTSIGFDVWNTIRERKGGQSEQVHSSQRASQIGTMVMILISVALAYVLPGSIIARATAMFMGLCAAALLPAFTHSLYAKVPSKRAAIASIATGSVSWLLWTAFVHLKESSALGLSKALFGTDAVLSAPWTVVDPLVIALPSSVIALGAMWWIDTRYLSDREAVTTDGLDAGRI